MSKHPILAAALVLSLAFVAKTQEIVPTASLDRDLVEITWDAPRVVFEQSSFPERARRSLRLSGQLSYPVAAEQAPPDWSSFDLELVLSRHAGRRLDWRGALDWNKSVRYRTTEPELGWDGSRMFDDFYDGEESAALIAADGRFQALVDLHAIQRLVGRTGEYQAGLLFMKTRRPGSSVTQHVGSVSLGGRLLEQSVTMLSIPGPDPLSPMQSTINASPPASPWTFEPLDLVRAVNRLHAMGFNSAVRELRDYLAVAQYTFGLPSLEHPDPRNPDHAGYGRVFLIMRLLFVPTDESMNHPPLHSGMMFSDGGDSYPGDLYPLILARDVPFFAPRWRTARSGVDSNPEDRLEWMAEHCKLRSEPLRPPDDPFKALEALEGLSGGHLPGNDPRRQLWLALEEVTGVPFPEKFDVIPVGLHPPVQHAQLDLTRLRAAASGLELYWNTESQSYRSRTREREAPAEEARQ